MQVHFGADLNCSKSKNDGANVLHPLGKVRNGSGQIGIVDQLQSALAAGLTGRGIRSACAQAGRRDAS